MSSIKPGVERGFASGTPGNASLKIFQSLRSGRKPNHLRLMIFDCRLALAKLTNWQCPGLSPASRALYLFGGLVPGAHAPGFTLASAPRTVCQQDRAPNAYLLERDSATPGRRLFDHTSVAYCLLPTAFLLCANLRNLWILPFALHGPDKYSFAFG